MSTDGDFWKTYNRDFWRTYGYEVPEGPRDALDPGVLARALGASLATDEEVICARFIWSARGRLIGAAGGGSGTHAIVVTDRRVMRVTAWRISEESSVRERLGRNEIGVTGFITRQSVWLGQIDDLEAGASWLTDQRLLLRTTDGRTQRVIARSETVLALEGAIREAMGGRGRWALPPPAGATPQLIGGWAERIAAVLRPAPRERG